MTRAIDVIAWMEGVGLALIALATAADWLRRRTIQQTWLAVAIGLLGLISVDGRVQQATGYRSLLLAHVMLVAFVASGFALALFRNSVVPLPRGVLGVLFAMLVGIGAAAFAVNLPSGLSPSPTVAQWVLVWAFILYWCGCVAEPGIRFWLASRGRPVVQRTRLRALSAGYGGIVVILLAAFGIGIVAGPSLLLNERYNLVMGLLGLSTVPVLYIGFAPPRWLRRIWRDREASALRTATAELLIDSDPAALLESSLDWALRLVGADRGLIVGAAGDVLARRDVDDTLAARLLTLEPGVSAHHADVGAGAADAAVVAPLPLIGGRAMIVVLPGPFTPVFGADELVRLGAYAASVASALERARLVGELRRQRDRYESILGAMSDLGEGFVMTRDSRVVYANDAYAQLIGYAPDELAELPPTLSIPSPANGAATRDGDDPHPRVSRNGDGHFETSMVARDGHRIDVEVAAKRLDGDPDAEKIAICRDITQRLRDERELVRRASELQRSNAALEDFAYIASHDLQEPLRMVASYLELLERRHRSELDEEALEFLGFAVDGARRMQALINDLLLYSRAGGLAEEPKPTDCSAVVDRVLANLRSTIEASGATVTVDPLPVVTAHATELVQVFQNLVGNALKFRGDAPPEIHVGCELEGEGWVFSVRDNGLGIEPRHADRIFMVFKRLHASKRYPGTGIGLAICKRVVERRGGRIWVEPAEGGGSVFRFTLPHEGAVPVPSPPERALALSG